MTLSQVPSVIKQLYGFCFFSLQPDDLNHHGKTKALLQQKAGVCAYPEHLTAGGLQRIWALVLLCWGGQSIESPGFEQSGQDFCQKVLLPCHGGGVVINVTATDLKMLQLNSAFWRMEATTSLYRGHLTCSVLKFRHSWNFNSNLEKFKIIKCVASVKE